MMTIKNYCKATSLSEAWELNQKKSNRILGGMLWLKMGSRNIGTAIDLSGLGLDAIKETDTEFSVGCMASLRDLELHGGMNAYTNGAVREALRHIVGVQFRNLATVGGSIYGRFGFSDVLTLFLAMDAYVELYKGGILPLAEFAKQKPDRDILVRLIVKKQPAAFAYQSVRNSSTDFPVLACAAAYNRETGETCASVGARPGRAVRFENPERISPESWTREKAERFASYVEAHVVTGSNMRAGAEYRKHLAGVLVRRTCMMAGGVKEC